MSMYNLLFGKNPNTEVVLAILGLKEGDIERFRDCGFDKEEIFIYTKTGGGNRDDYPNDKLVSNPYYLRDEDDDFDSTYATYYFKFPEEVKDDVEKFKDVRKNGISGKLISWILKTLERKETKSDKYHRLWNEQNRLVQQSKQTFIYETNGWIIVPLDDTSLEKYLKLMEEAGGEQLSYSVKPYKVVIKENAPKWESLDKNKSEIEKEMCRIKIDFPKEWEIDKDLWERWQKKYSKKYPKSIAMIAKEIK